MDDSRVRAEMLTAIGGLGAIGITAILATVNGPLGQVNVALILVLFVAGIAASGGRGPGWATGLLAALSYNFFHTEPTHSFRIDHPRDILTVVLLGLVGLVVGEISRRWHRSQWVAARSDLGLNRVVRVAELATAGTDLETLVAAVEYEIRVELRLAEVRFEMGGEAGEDRPVLGHNGSVQEPVKMYLDDEFALPTSGVDLAVTYRGREFGRLFLRPNRPQGIAIEQRRCAVAIADQLGAALATMVP